jgi:HlyD family secretion protein
MSRGRIVAVAVSLLVILVVAVAYARGREDNSGVYRFVTVERGDLEATVSATGKLEAVTAVQVGTQVSGQVSAILADFNDRVRRGQLIARIDPTLQQQAVSEALAGLERAQAELAQAQREFDRNQQLFERKVLTEAEFNNSQYRLAVARSTVRSAQVSLARARQNLAYTSIYSPIDGIVVERNVDVGQTVAASLQAPQLFLIANDLARMQILASVDESDIGVIREGQPVRFTVQAYPNESFEGTVRQVRLQSSVQENVVNYTVVIEVANTTGRLLPGMTATVDFLTGSARDVLLVPNAALRFRPTEAMLAYVRATQQGGESQGRDPANGAVRRDTPAMQTAGDTAARAAGDTTRRGEPGGSARQARGAQAGQGGGGPPGGGRAGQRGGRANSAVLWYLDPAGKPAMVRVRTGLSDGQRTQVEAPTLTEGMQIIVGTTQAAAAGGSNPFQQQRQTGPRGPGGF